MSDDVESLPVHRADYGSPIELTAEIVCAFVSNNAVPISGLADLILSVHAGLNDMGKPATPVANQPAKATAVQIKRSITDAALISFEDSKPYKTLKRHLTMRGLTPETYRAKYGLPADYPMTAATYSAQRSELARSLGLGQQGRKAEPKSAEVFETVAETPKARRGRPASGVAPKTPEKAKARRKAAMAVAD